MPAIACPLAGCEFRTEDVDPAVAAVLLTIHATEHTTHTSTSSAKVEKVKRPTVSSAGSSEDWAYFESRWADYVDATKISGKDMVMQLLECCDDDLRKDLTRNAGGSLANKPEKDVLAAIKRLAVRVENCMVARVHLHNMRQDRDETIRSFGARIRGQAGVCRFSISCPGCESDVNYTDAILRDVLTRGMADSEIQLDLLSDVNQDMSLEEAFQFIEAKEAGKRSAMRLLDSHGADSTHSSYKKEKKSAIRSDEQCGYCGKNGHGKSAPVVIRKKSCTAFDHSCVHCGRRNHFDSMCRNKDNPRRPRPSRNPTGTMDNDEEGAVFDALCTISTFGQHKGRRSINLDHHLYDNLCDRWVRQASKPQPFVQVNVAIHQTDYKDFGFTLRPEPDTVNKYAMADTGCQSCLAGLRAVRQLGLTEKDLIPVSMRMHAANNNNIKILGAAIIRFSGRSESGQVLETRQITYVTDSSDKIFLSREACEELGMITPNFPKIGEVQISTHVIGEGDRMDVHDDTDRANQSESNHDMRTSANPYNGETATCGCLKRKLPPIAPTKLPFPATEANREKLEQYLLHYYKSPTFNICEHQHLPMMDVPH